MENLEVENLDIRKLIKKQCGNGKDTSFWNDPWLLDISLQNKYPRPFDLETNKSITVEEKLNTPIANWQWQQRPYESQP